MLRQIRWQVFGGLLAILCSMQPAFGHEAPAAVATAVVPHERSTPPHIPTVQFSRGDQLGVDIDPDHGPRKFKLNPAEAGSICG